MRRNQIAMNLLINLEATGTSEVLRKIAAVQSRVDALSANEEAQSRLQGSRNVLTLAQEQQDLARKNIRSAENRLRRFERTLGSTYNIGAGATDTFNSIKRLDAFKTATEEVRALYRDSGMNITAAQARRITYDAIVMGDRSMFTEFTARNLYGQRERSQQALHEQFRNVGYGWIGEGENRKWGLVDPEANRAAKAAYKELSGQQATLRDYKSFHSETSGDVARAAAKYIKDLEKIDREIEKTTNRIAALTGEAASELKALELAYNNAEREHKKTLAAIALAQKTGTRIVPDALITKAKNEISGLVEMRQGIRAAGIAGTPAEAERVAKQYSVHGDADMVQKAEAFTNTIAAANENRQFYLDRERTAAANAAAGLATATRMRGYLSSDLRRMSQGQLESYLDDMVRHRESVVHMSRTNLSPDGQKALMNLMAQYGVDDPDELVGIMNSQIARTRSTLGRSSVPQTFGNTLLGALMGSGRTGAYGRAYNSPFNRFNAQVTNFAQMGGLSLYGLGTIGLVTALSKNTLGQASEAESMKNVLAGMVNTYYEFYNLQGKVQDRQDTFNKSLEMSEKLYGKIRERAIASILTTQEMFEYVLSGTPLLMRQGLNFDESLTVVDSIASLGKAMGYHTPAIMSDIRDYAMVNVTSRSQVLRSIGIDGTELSASIAKGPEALREYFREKISGFEGTLARIENTPQGRMSRFQDLIQQSSIIAGEGAMPGFLKGLESLYTEIDQMSKDGTLEKAGENLGRFLNTIMTLAAQIAGSPIFQNLASNPGGALATAFGGYLTVSSYASSVKHRLLNPESVEEMRATGRFSRIPGPFEYAMIGTLLSDEMGIDRQGRARPNSMRARVARWLARPFGVGADFDPKSFVGPMPPHLEPRGAKIGRVGGGVLKGAIMLLSADQLLLPLIDRLTGFQEPSVLQARAQTYTEAKDSISLERGLRSLSMPESALRRSEDARRKLLLLDAGKQAYQQLPDELRLFQKGSSELAGFMAARDKDLIESSGLHVLVAAAESMRRQAESGGGRMESIAPRIQGIRDSDAIGYRDLINDTPGLLDALLKEAEDANRRGYFSKTADGSVGIDQGKIEQFYLSTIGARAVTATGVGAASAYMIGVKDLRSKLEVALTDQNLLSPEDRQKFIGIVKDYAAKGGLKELLINDYMMRPENLNVRENDMLIRQRLGLAADVQGAGYGVIGAQLSRRLAGVNMYSSAAANLVGQQRALGIASAQQQYLSDMASPDANPLTTMLKFAQTIEQVEAAYESSLRAIVQERVARQENAQAIKDHTSLLRMEIETVRLQGQRDAMPLNSMADVTAAFGMDLRIARQQLATIDASASAALRAIRGQGKAESVQSMSLSQLEKAAGTGSISLQDQTINGFRIEFDAMQKAFTAQFSASQQAIQAGTYSFEAALKEQATAQKGLEDAVLKHVQQLGLLGGNIQTLSDAINALASIASGTSVPTSAPVTAGAAATSRRNTVVRTAGTPSGTSTTTGTSLLVDLAQRQGLFDIKTPPVGTTSNAVAAGTSTKPASLPNFIAGLVSNGGTIYSSPIGPGMKSQAAGQNAYSAPIGPGLGTPLAKAANSAAAAMLEEMGRAIKSPGSDAHPACADFASQIIAQITDGITDKGGQKILSAQGLVDRVRKVGGADVPLSNAQAGALAYRPGRGRSGVHVGIYLGDGRVMDMNGQRDRKRNTFGIDDASGWKFINLPGNVDLSGSDSPLVAAVGGNTALQQAQEEQERIRAELERERARQAMLAQFRALAGQQFGMIERQGAMREQNEDFRRRFMGIGSTARGADAIQERYFASLDFEGLISSRMAEARKQQLNEYLAEKSASIAQRVLSGELTDAQGRAEFEKVSSNVQAQYLAVTERNLEIENRILQRKAAFARKLEEVTRDVTFQMSDAARAFDVSMAGIGVYGPGRGLAIRGAERQSQISGLQERLSVVRSDIERDTIANRISPSLATIIQLASNMSRASTLEGQIRELAEADARDRAQFEAGQMRTELQSNLLSARGALGLNSAQIALDRAQRSFGVGIGGPAMGLGQQMQEVMAQSLQANLSTLGVREAEIRRNRFNELVNQHGEGEGKARYESPEVQLEIQQQIEQLKVGMLRQAARSYNSPKQQNAIRSAIMQDRIINTVSEGGGAIISNPMMLFAGAERSAFMSSLVGPYIGEQMGQLSSRLALSGALATGRNLSSQQLQILGLRSVNGQLFRGGQKISANRVFRTQLGESAAMFGGNLLGQFAGTALGGDPASVNLGTQIGALAGPGLFAGLGMYGGPVGAVAGGILGGLFGRRRNNQEEQEARQWRQNVLRLMGQMDKSLRPVGDYFQTAKGEQLFGTASRYHGNRYNSGLGREAALGVL